MACSGQNNPLQTCIQGSANDGSQQCSWTQLNVTVDLRLSLLVNIAVDILRVNIRNVGQLQIYDAAHTQKPKFCIERQPRKLMIKNYTPLKGGIIVAHQTTRHIHPNDGNCRVYRNVGQFPIFDAAHARKRRFCKIGCVHERCFCTVNVNSWRTLHVQNNSFQMLVFSLQ
jgi:hypothetical protein